MKTACDLCRRRKLRCDGESPCRQCRTGHSDCQYSSGTSFQTTRDLDLDFEASNVDSPLEDDMDLQDNSHEPPVASDSASRKEATFTDVNFAQGLVREPPSFSYGPSDRQVATTETDSILPDVVSELDPAILLQTDIENDMMPEFWQVPLLVSQESSVIIWEC